MLRVYLRGLAERATTLPMRSRVAGLCATGARYRHGQWRMPQSGRRPVLESRFRCLAGRMRKCWCLIWRTDCSSFYIGLLISGVFDAPNRCGLPLWLRPRSASPSKWPMAQMPSCWRLTLTATCLKAAGKRSTLQMPSSPAPHLHGRPQLAVQEVCRCFIQSVVFPCLARDKVFGGFTNNASFNGDKQVTLIALQTLASQHGGDVGEPGHVAEQQGCYAQR